MVRSRNTRLLAHLLLLTGFLAVQREGSASAEGFSFAPIANEKYTEQYNAFADLDDGSYVQVQVGVTNVGPGDKKGLCRFALIRGGKLLADNITLDPEQWRVEAKPERIVMGPCTVTPGPPLVFSVPLGKAKIELRLDGDLKKLRTAKLKTEVASDFYQSEVLIPWAQATVSIDGKVLAGKGYLDHSRAAILPGDLAKSWVRFRDLRSEEPRILLVRMGKNDEIQGYQLTRGKGQSRVTQASIRQGTARGQRAFRVQGEDEHGQWRITSRELLHRFAPLEENGVLGSVVSMVVGNPVTYLYRGVLEEKGRKQPVTGLFEVTVTDE
jgi:hypothetical protein